MRRTQQYLSTGFYSTLVRLKDGITMATMRQLKKFLFHTGSIKRFVRYDVEIPVITFLFHTGSIKRQQENQSMKKSLALFLFHTGSIKSTSTYNLPPILLLFLFHTGSIKRVENQEFIDEHVSFLFHTGSIKRTLCQLPTTYAEHVSIPHWFD